jgi:cell division protease FtsH
MNTSTARKYLPYLLIFVGLLALILVLSNANRPANDLAFSALVANIRQDPSAIRSITVSGSEIRVAYTNKNLPDAVSRKESSSAFVEQLSAFGLTPAEIAALPITVQVPNVWFEIIQLIFLILPSFLVVGLLVYMIRQMQGGNNQTLGFGKSRARVFTGDRPTIIFDDVAGADEAKDDLREVVEFLKAPEKFLLIGARIPKGLLLIGGPGTGKTLLAKAVAGEAGVPFFSISGSEFVEMFVGVGASRVRDLFNQARQHSPCIIFVDEIDAVGRQRGNGWGGGNDEREQTLNQILVEMDGFDSDTNLIIIAATNRPDVLDPALTRPGRFDRRVIIDRPDMRGREAILKVHTRNKPLAADVNLALLARETTGFVGADLENMLNEAAILAARRNRKSLTMRDCEEAIYRVLLGPERKSRLLSPEQKRLVAYHESGHAIVGHFLPHCNPVRKITIVPRGMAGGAVLSVPEDDTNLETKARIEDHIAQALGGRAAEALIFGEITTGAGGGEGSALAVVTRYARAMVTRFGMSERLGPIIFGKGEEATFMGREMAEQRDYSETVAQIIDEEVRRIVETAYQRAAKVLSDHHEKLERVAQRLLELETLEEADFLSLVNETHGTARKRPELLPKSASQQVP